MQHRPTVRHHGSHLGKIAHIVLMAAALVWLTTGIALAEDTGRRDYERTCAVCHGADGRGNGEAVRVLVGLEPGDLTQLSKQHGGEFPADAVYKAIDGRDEVSAHHLGRRRMPVWGLDFQLGAEHTPESEASLRRRISALAHYVGTMQEK